MHSASSEMSSGYPTNFFQSYNVLKKVSGIWLPGNEYNVAFKLLHLIYVLFFYGNCIIVTVGLYIITVYLTDVNEIASHLGPVLTAVNGNIKFFILALGHAKLKKIIDVVQDQNYQYVSVRESDPGSLFRKGMNVTLLLSYSAMFTLFTRYLTSPSLQNCWSAIRAHAFFTVFETFDLVIYRANLLNFRLFLLVFMYCSTGISGNISTVIKLNNELEDDTFESVNKTCEDFLSYKFFVPFPTNTKWQCILASNILNIGMVVQAYIHAIHDGLLSGLLNCLKTQFLVIGEVFKTIRRRSLVNINMSEDYSIYHDEDNPLLEEEMYRQLTHSIKHLKILLAVRDEIEHIFTFVLLIQVLTSLLIYASNLYITSSVSVFSSYFFAQMNFFVAVLIQLSFMCWFGNEIGNASTSISFSLYESDWFSCSPRFKKSIILTMIRMQRPVYLSIGKFSPLTLATLVTVCRGSYSYFTLFRSIQ